MRRWKLSPLACAGALAAVTLCASAWAQEGSPFDASAEFGEPAAATGDPFADAGQPAADPFGTAGGAQPSPFGESPANAMAPAEGSDGDFFDPFSGSPFPGIGAQPADGAAAAAAQPADGDPFGGAADPAVAAQPAAAAQGDPFGGGGGDPFGGASPFGADPGSPFGAPTDPATADAAPATGGIGITQLYEWRYEEKATWDGRIVAVRTRMTKQEAEAYDQQRMDQYRELIRNRQLAGYDNTSDPNIWAEWAYFADQTYLWGKYVDSIALAGVSSSSSSSASSTSTASASTSTTGGGGAAGAATATPSVSSAKGTYSRIQWPGAGRLAAAGAAAGGQGGQPLQVGTGAEAVVAANQGQSLDQQAGSFFTSPGSASEAPGFFKAQTIREQILTAYYSDLDTLRSMEEDQEEYMNGFETRIQERASRRVAYADWRRDQEMLVEEFVNDWNRRYNGEVALIGGVRYELYRPGEVPDRVRRETNVVVTDYRLTPYDILTEEGKLREASRD